MKWPRRIRLKDADEHRHYFMLADVVGPITGTNRSIEQLARPITAQHQLFGKVELNSATFQSFIKNFNENAYGQEIYIDRNHNIDAGVQGKILRLSTTADKLLAEIEWTPAGVKTFNEDGFKYFSIDFTDDYVNPETKKSYGPLLFGAALTPRPFVKNMTASQGPGRLLLSEGRSVFVPQHIQLTEESPMKLSEMLAALRAKLASIKLSEALIGILVGHAEAAGKLLGEGDPKLAQLQIAIEAEGAKLAEYDASKHSAQHHNAGLQLTADEVKKMIAGGVATALSEAEAQRVQLTATLETNRKRFTDAITAAKGLSDATRQLLGEQAAAITAAMTPAQVEALANTAIKLGDSMEVQAKKLGLGLRTSATGQLPHVTLNSDIGTSVHALMRERLLLSDDGSSGKLRLPEEKNLKSFARKVLAQFDAIHGHRLESEHKMLSGDGSTVISDGNFPVVAQRQVIVELLADLQFLALVNTIVDPTAQTTMQIPYEIRNTSTIKNGAITFEGKPIARAGVTQAMDASYIIPRKIALLMSDEMINFSRNALINWDAWARNIGSNARLMRDIMAGAIANAMQRAADSYQAVAVALEVHTGQVDGTRNLFKATNWPIVRSHQPRDLQGTAVGAAQNPITALLAAATLQEYDGTGTQSAGNYLHITDYNLGFYQIVNQAGVVQTPANTTVLKLSYSYATNVDKFDLDLSGDDYDVHLNGLLNKIGRRKATLSQTRFVVPDFAVCSPTLLQTISEAQQFERQHEKNGTALNADGSVGMVKQIPVWNTNQPGIDMGDARIMLGEKGNTSYGIQRPFATGAPFEVVAADATGALVPTGEKQAYGTEYSTIHTPVPVRGRVSSVIVYSTTARAAA